MLGGEAECGGKIATPNMWVLEEAHVEREGANRVWKLIGAGYGLPNPQESYCILKIIAVNIFLVGNSLDK